MKRIILITGGARSGKKQPCGKTGAKSLSYSCLPCCRTYWDEEFRQRVIRHQQRRGPEWTNIEEEKKELSRHQLIGRTVLIDCVTFMVYQLLL